ncbi:MAG TPA: hypothetical protein PKD09_09365 [Aggregatilinea sp.]|uniref:hypothetical protein n=1 Tax=Aggregatilinea sp. TaxID=2806333 RepID=UPI002C12B3FD|nr:hypothetical protein [Aggregatilinea sp.]HML21845.1 hypothetical protein [Aggregatilinea sp.]
MQKQFSSEVAATKLIDLLEDGGEDLPPHLLAVLQANEYESVGELRDDCINADEEEREQIWAKADRAALLRVLLPYTRPDGRVSNVGRKLVGWLASDWKVSGQSVRRYIDLGLNYPPEIKETDPETGEVTTILVRDPATPMSIYLAGLLGERYGIQPLEAVLYAIRMGLSAGQLRTWIKEERYRQQGDIPPVSREWYAERLDGEPGRDAVAAALADAQETVEREFKRLLARGVLPQMVAVTVRAIEPAEVLTQELEGEAARA